MKKRLFSLGLIAFFAWGCQNDMTDTPLAESDPQPQKAARQSAKKIIPGKYIVVLKEDNSMMGMAQKMRGKASGIMKRCGGSDAQIDHMYSSTIQGFSASLTPGLYKQMVKDAEVAYIEEDFEVSLFQSDDGEITTQSTQTVPWGISRVGGAGNGVGKTAWILDTGIQTNHPDLNVNAARGFSVFRSGSDAGVNDRNGHGTHVAGTIAARNNSIGVIGVAAGATVIPVKVLGASGSGSMSGIVAGVDFVAANGRSGDVANMSLGGGISNTLDAAVLRASSRGIRFVIAAGNSSERATNTSPARVNGPNIYTISAHDINNVFASFSNFGNPPIDFCAPGVSVNSTWIGSSYRSKNGTSMAAPHVAGILLLGPVRSRGRVTRDRDTTPDLMASR